MRLRVGHWAIISLFTMSTISVSGCGAVTSVVAGNGTPPVKKPTQPPYVVTVSHAETITSDSSGSPKEVSATCQANSLSVGGGYRFQEGEQNLTDPYLVESRPSANGWTVGIDPTAGEIAVAVTAYARCLVGGAGTVTVQSASIDATASGPAQIVTAQVTCPTGSTAVGGGFSIREGLNVVSEFPSGGGKFADVSGHDVVAGATAFAICYSLPVAVSIVRDHRVQAGGDLYDIYTANYATSCPVGASMTSGGYEALPYVGIPFINGPDTQGANWDVELLRKNGPVNTSGAAGELACVTFS